MNHFLYLRGQPGVGKITIAKLLEKELGWRVFWFHDLKNAVYNIVKEHRIPRLMDELTRPVVRYLLEKNDNIIYVRPSPERETVESIKQLVDEASEYKLHIVRLEAAYETLLERVSERDDPFRISSKRELDEYVNSRSEVNIDGEHIIKTDGLTPEEVAANILTWLGVKEKQ